MNTSAHSPLPWRVSTNYGVAHHVCSDTGLIAVCDAGDYARSRLEGAANAALIVSSVNAHASLVERVKELEKALRETVDALKDVVNAAGNDQPYSPKELGELFAGIASGSEDVLARGGP